MLTGVCRSHCTGDSPSSQHHQERRPHSCRVPGQDQRGEKQIIFSFRSSLLLVTQSFSCKSQPEKKECNYNEMLVQFSPENGFDITIYVYS